MNFDGYDLCFGGSGGSVPVVSLVPVVPFRWLRSLRWFRWFRSGGWFYHMPFFRHSFYLYLYASSQALITNVKLPNPQDPPCQFFNTILQYKKLQQLVLFLTRRGFRGGARRAAAPPFAGIFVRDL